ncbi:MAG: methyltransferase domain-containing protein [Chloroflexi bacterium]|nr:methyltransferase domain-containing protein [Chloroflexota bacterium]
MGCAIARDRFGLEVWRGVLPDARVEAESFDAVTLWDVIEHVPDPGALLWHCARVLRSGSLLALSTPDIGSPFARLTGRRWYELIRVHLYYFSRLTLTRLLTDTGFQIRYLRAHPHYFTLGHLAHRLAAYAPAPARALAAILTPFPRLRARLIPINLFDWIVIAAEKPSGR